MSESPGTVTRRALISTAAIGATLEGAAFAQTPRLSATTDQSDAREAIDFMRGFPPAPGGVVNETNWQTWPQAKWAVWRMREVFPSRDASLPGVRARPLQEALRPLDDIAIATEDGVISWAEFLALTHTDAVLVMQNGRILYERYFGDATAETPHILFSAGKSYCGFLAEVLAARGVLDFARPVEHYLPELASSGFAGATVRQIADMTDGARFVEDYTDPTSDAFVYLAEVGLGPREGRARPIGAYAALQRLTAREAAPGNIFRYRSCATDVLGWVLQRVTGKSLSRLYAEEIYGPCGCSGPAYFTLDAAGQEVAAGGLSATLRDFARFGEMLRRQGRVGGRQVFPPSVAASIFAGGDRQVFAGAGQATRIGWSYKSQFWVTHDQRNSVWLLGVRGQRLLVAPQLNLVMAKFGSHPVLGNAATDAIHAAAIDGLERALG